MCFILAPFFSKDLIASSQTWLISSEIPSIVYSFGIPIVFPFKSEFRFFEKLGILTLELVLSLWSWPAISSSSIDASVTFFEKTPAWSRLDAKAAIPHLDISRK